MINFIYHPIGYVDKDGNLHRQGVMRLATAMDEIAPLCDPRVRFNQAYLVMILLSQVIVQLRHLTNITTQIMERFLVICQMRRCQM